MGGTVRSWDDTLGRFGELGVTPVPTLYRGPYHSTLFDDLSTTLDLATQEGFVARVASAFPENDMSERMGKYVRDGHVQSESHWMKAPLVHNKMA